MQTISLYENNWDIEARVWDKCDWLHKATRVVTTRVSGDIFDIIMYDKDLEKSKRMMRMLYRDLS